MRRSSSLFNVDAISGDAELFNAPLSALVGEARIHSVFERVINVEIGRGRLMTLAASESENAPDTIVTNICSWSEADLEPGRAVRHADGVVFLGEGVRISLARAMPWHCRLPMYAADPDRLRTTLAMARGQLAKQGKGISVTGENKADANQKPEGSVDQALRSVFARASNGLCAALAGGDLEAAQGHVEQLVGLGPGLTPAGDDFLLGLLTALNIPESPAYALRTVGSFVLNCADRQTHLVSLAALRHAAEGRARESVVALCEALMRGDSATLRSGLERVLRIGSSSGTEIALGLLSGFAIHLQRGLSGE